MQASRRWVLLAMGNSSCTYRGGRTGGTGHRAGLDVPTLGNSLLGQLGAKTLGSKETLGAAGCSPISFQVQTFPLLLVLYN